MVRLERERHSLPQEGGLDGGGRGMVCWGFRRRIWPWRPRRRRLWIALVLAWMCFVVLASRVRLERRIGVAASRLDGLRRQRTEGGRRIAGRRRRGTRLVSARP